MSFAAFPAQQQVVGLLQRSLERNRLAHGYLFSGSDLGELEAVARTLAKTLNCANPPQRGETGLPLDSCDQCDSCQRIDASNHPDVRWFRPESKTRIISVDQMRGLIEAVNLKPTLAAYKFSIIVAADRLKTEGANAFLKTLEEPPPRSILILLTTEPQRILETIISRCLRLNFSGERKFEEPIVAWLTEFAASAANPKSGLLGRYRLLDVLLQKLSGDKEEIKKVLEERSPLNRYDDLEPALREKYEKELDAAIEAEYRRQRSDLLLALEIWLRDVWLHSLGNDTGLASFPALQTHAQAVAQRISPADAAENMQVLEKLQRLLATNIQEALTLEVGFLKLKL